MRRLVQQRAMTPLKHIERFSYSREKLVLHSFIMFPLEGDSNGW